MTVSAPSDVQAAADAAFEYGYPLTEVMRVGDTLPEVNKVHLRTKLSTPADTSFVLPNNDTLYAEACVYLGDGWVQLTLPPRGDRYLSAEIFDAYTNNVGLASSRDIPADGAKYILRLAGSSSDGIPRGATVFDVPTPFAYILARTLVDGPPDLAAANAVQRGITLQPQAATTAGRRSTPSGATPAQSFFLTLMQRLAQNPPPPAEKDLVASFAKAGIRASLEPDLSQVTEVERAVWEVAHANGIPKIERAGLGLNPFRGTWLFPNANVATPGTNYTLRAVTAHFGIFPLPPTESIYPRTLSDGSKPRVLQLPKTWPPIDPAGFWSLTLYVNGVLFDNPIHRYSIGNRTPGLRREADGSLKLYIQPTDPGGARSSNWLPCPEGPYSMTMRLYLPDASTRDPSFTLPALE